jgi:hypothetical protein
MYEGMRSRACETCGRLRAHGELNHEAVTHHGARLTQCIDRKDCERAKRKATRYGRCLCGQARGHLNACYFTRKGKR